MADNRVGFGIGVGLGLGLGFACSYKKIRQSLYRPDTSPACPLGFCAAQPTSNASFSCMDLEKDHFKGWVIAACRSRHSEEYKQLYHHLVNCFVAGDLDCTGTVTADQFNHMIDIAAEAPRKFGYAPEDKDMFKNDAEKRAARTKMFKDMDTDNSGTITLEEWLNFSYTHICEKAKTLDRMLSGKPPVERKQCVNFDKNHFKAWVIAACRSRQCAEYKELYHHLLECFVAGDVDRTGTVTAAQFNHMIDVAAEAPRRFGYAPEDKEMFKNDGEKRAARMKMFSDMDTDKSGTITFNEWFNFSYAHICQKAKTLDPTLSGKPPLK